jgi:hypothetical protein
VAKAGGAFAAEKISGFHPRKAGLKVIFGLREGSLYEKAGPSFPTTFLLVPGSVGNFFKFLRFLQFS